jgi:hypothetical protein
MPDNTISLFMVKRLWNNHGHPRLGDLQKVASSIFPVRGG